jgi:hypothetical protein
MKKKNSFLKATQSKCDRLANQALDSLTSQVVVFGCIFTLNNILLSLFKLAGLRKWFGFSLAGWWS